MIERENKKTIAIIILIVLLVGSLFYLIILPGYNSIIYNEGISVGKILVAEEQTITGNIFYIQNNSVKTIPITELCGGGG